MRLVTVTLCAVLTVAAQDQFRSHSMLVLRCVEICEPQETDVVADEPEPSDTKERQARKAKNVRYNTGRPDLTKRDPQEKFIEQVWPSRELVPIAQSAVVVAGTVVKVQPYLSGDRSRIYTEITVEVDNVLKLDRNDRLSSQQNIVIDRLGGALKLKTSRVVRDDVHIDFLGQTQPGKRYIFFARSVHEGKDIDLIGSYELREGKVFTNDTRPARLISTLPGVPQAWGNEEEFLKAVRQVNASGVGAASLQEKLLSVFVNWNIAVHVLDG